MATFASVLDEALLTVRSAQAPFRVDGIRLLIAAGLLRLLATSAPTYRRFLRHKRVRELLEWLRGTSRETASLEFTAISCAALVQRYTLGFGNSKEVEAILDRLSKSSRCELDQAGLTPSYDGSTTFDFRSVREVEIERDIFCDVTPSDVDVSAGTFFLMLKKINLRLYSYVYDVARLREVVQSWTHQAEKVEKLTVQVYQFEERVCDSHTLDLTTQKTFATCYFEHKERTLKEIDFFLRNRGWYEARGLPYCLSILIYGERGCGKTSFLKALLNHTRRKAALFCLNKHSGLKQIEDVMVTEQQEIDQQLESGLLADWERTVIILQDVDAMGDVVRKRANSLSQDAPEETETHSANLAVVSTALPGGAAGGTLDKLKSMLAELKRINAEADEDKQSGSADLGAFLNLLDGVMEFPGRILVMTATRIDHLDPALIRPGRVDISLEFKRCSRVVLKQMVSDFFSRDPRSWELPDSIKDGIITPGRVVQLCRSTMDDLESCVALLQEESLAEEISMRLRTDAYRQQQEFLSVF